MTKSDIEKTDVKGAVGAAPVGIVGAEGDPLYSSDQTLKPDSRNPQFATGNDPSKAPPIEPIYSGDLSMKPDYDNTQARVGSDSSNVKPIDPTYNSRHDPQPDPVMNPSTRPIDVPGTVNSPYAPSLTAVAQGSDDAKLPKTRGQKIHSAIGFWGLGYGGVFALSAALAFVARHHPVIGNKFQGWVNGLTEKSNGLVDGHESGIRGFLNSELHPPKDSPPNRVVAVGDKRIGKVVSTTATIFALHWGGNVMLAPIKYWEDNARKISNWFDKKFGTGLDAQTEQKVLAQSDETRFGTQKSWGDWINGRITTMALVVFPTGFLVSLVPQLNFGLNKLEEGARAASLKAFDRNNAYPEAVKDVPAASKTIIGKNVNIDFQYDTNNLSNKDQAKAINVARWSDVAAFDAWYTMLTAAILFTTSKIFANRRQKGKSREDNVPDNLVADQAKSSSSYVQEQYVEANGAAVDNHDRSESRRKKIAPSASKTIEGPKSPLMYANTQANVSPSL